MRVLLVSQKPNAPTITGEMVFVENLTHGLLERGIEITNCEVGTDRFGPQALRMLLRYSRVPGLLRSALSLSRIPEHDITHFLDSSLALAGVGRKSVKIASSHVLARAHYAFRPRGSALDGMIESAYRGYSSNLDRYAFGKMDCIVAESPFHARDLCSTYGLPGTKMERIAPGVDNRLIKGCLKDDLKSRFGKEHAVVYVARLDSPAKGLSHFIRAAELLKAEGIAFLVVGDGPERAHYERLIIRSGLSNTVFFLGALPFREKTVIQKSADATVIPSISETFCMVFAESLACGTPVVAFDLPFWEGLYDGAGFFVKRNSESLAKGILAALHDAKARRRAVAKGRKLAQEYDVKKTASSYVRLYEGLV